MSRILVYWYIPPFGRVLGARDLDEYPPKPRNPETPKIRNYETPPRRSNYILKKLNYFFFHKATTTIYVILNLYNND